LKEAEFDGTQPDLLDHVTDGICLRWWMREPKADGNAGIGGHDGTLPGMGKFIMKTLDP
jgi:hypothetical protein